MKKTHDLYKKSHHSNFMPKKSEVSPGSVVAKVKKAIKNKQPFTVKFGK